MLFKSLVEIESRLYCIELNDNDCYVCIVGGDIYISNFISGMAEVVACVLIIPGRLFLLIALQKLIKYECSKGL